MAKPSPRPSALGLKVEYKLQNAGSAITLNSGLFLRLKEDLKVKLHRTVENKHIKLQLVSRLQIFGFKNV